MSGADSSNEMTKNPKSRGKGFWENIVNNNPSCYQILQNKGIWLGTPFFTLSNIPQGHLKE